MAGHGNISPAMVEDAEKRSFVMKIDEYSRTKGLLDSGKYVTSAPFSVGGHNWVVEYFPNGAGRGSADFISVFLVLDSVCAKDVKAKFRFSLCDKDGEPVSSHSKTCMHTFSSKGSDWGFTSFMKKADLEGSVHLKDDCFAIRCDVTVIWTDICSEAAKGNQSVVVPPCDLHRHFGDLLKNMDGADMTFQVGRQRLSAHRSVLAARSSVFKAQFFGAMKEKADSVIEIDGIEADVLKSLLHFIYTDALLMPEMTREGSNVGDVCGDVAMAGHLLVAADRYNVERLKLICEEKLCTHIESNTVAASLALAEQHSFHGLKEACFKFLAFPSNLEAMRVSDGYEHLKSSCPSVLKELVAGLLPVEHKAAKDIIMEF